MTRGNRALIMCVVLMFGIGFGIAAQTAGTETKPEVEFKLHKAGQYEFKWRIVGTELEVIISAPTTGWVAIGFNPTTMMKDANFILAYVKAGKTEISDEFGIAITAHRSDTALGGTQDVRVVEGKEAGGKTEIRFIMPLATTDKYDRPLRAGVEVPIIWAYGPNGADNFMAPHVARGGFKLSL